jgi:undecaprenyl-diphosphatase
VRTDLVTRINDVAISTPWLHGPITASASLGLVLFAGLMVVGWWLARGRDDRVMAAALLAPVGAVVAVVLQQPLIQWAGHARPLAVHPDALTSCPARPTRRSRPTTPASSGPSRRPSSSHSGRGSPA